MNKFRDRMYRFMYGRYGQDLLGQVIVVVALVLCLISAFTSPFVYLVSLGLIGYEYFRMFSKNIYARRKENDWFLRKTAGIRGWFRKQNDQRARNANYKIYKCPECKQKIRVPKGRGRIEIRCRMCSTTFIKKT